MPFTLLCTTKPGIKIFVIYLNFYLILNNHFSNPNFAHFINIMKKLADASVSVTFLNFLQPNARPLVQNSSKKIMIKKLIKPKPFSENEKKNHEPSTKFKF